jgi:hypothetical protein
MIVLETRSRWTVCELHVRNKKMTSASHAVLMANIVKNKGALLEPQNDFKLDALGEAALGLHQRVEDTVNKCKSVCGIPTLPTRQRHKQAEALHGHWTWLSVVGKYIQVAMTIARVSCGHINHRWLLVFVREHDLWTRPIKELVQHCFTGNDPFVVAMSLGFRTCAHRDEESKSLLDKCFGWRVRDDELTAITGL